MASSRLRILCRIMAVAAVLGALFVAGGMAASLLNAALLFPATSILKFEGVPMTADIPAIHRFAAALLAMVPDWFSLWVCVALWRLMRLYAGGEVFAAPALAQIRVIGFALLGGAIALLVFKPLSGMVLTWHLGDGHRALSFSFGNEDAVRLFQAAMVFIIARVMEEARRLADENAGFI